MNNLEKFHKDLDDSNWDIKQEDIINKSLQDISDQFFRANSLDLHHITEIERQAFLFSKTPEKKLSFRVAGTRRMEDGRDIPFEWPDIRAFKETDFKYLYLRFKNTKNTYAKTEYGLVLYYSNSKDGRTNEFAIELLRSLFELSQKYINKAKPDNDKDRYILYARPVLANALHIANNRKAVIEISEIFQKLIKYTFEVYKEWDMNNRASLRIISDFTDFAVQYFKDFEQTVDVKQFVKKNWETANDISHTDVWGAIYIADISIKLCRKLNSDIKDWLYFKAEQYEKLTKERSEELASLSFVEKAMAIYKGLKDESNLERLKLIYQKLRTSFNLGEISQEMPQEETQRLIQTIKKAVNENSEEEIIKILLFTPMIKPFEEIKKWSDDSFKETMLGNMLPASVKDNFGNTVAQYTTDEERNKFSLLRTYEAHMQIAVQTILYLFIDALREDKISENGILNFLSQTWIGEEKNRYSNGIQINFSYLKLVESGISSLFQELLKWKDDSNYFPNFVSATDSLVLKAEYFLREFCNFLGIATFKPNPKKSGIIMEKTLDDLLNDLEGKLSIDDHFFIKFILSEKVGYNLRNKIAHGLMDNVEYGLEYPILAIIIILKLSNYQFTPTKND